MLTLSPQAAFLAIDTICVAAVLLMVRILWLIAAERTTPEPASVTQPVPGVRRHSRAGGYWPTAPYARSRS